MTNQELLEILKSKIMLNEMSTEELTLLMDICECDIINRMAAAAGYMED
jgi:hypothetical protein